MTEPKPRTPPTPLPSKTLPMGAPARGGDTDAAGPAVVEIEGLSPGTRSPLDREATAIGRADDNDVVLKSPAVSKQHARITRRESQFWIEDLASTNGVEVNGTKLTPREPRVLSHGDTIRLSDHLLLFHRGRMVPEAGGTAAAIAVDQDEVRRQVDALLTELPGLRSPRRPPR